MGEEAREAGRVPRVLSRVNLATTGGRRVWSRDSMGAGSGGVGAS